MGTMDTRRRGARALLPLSLGIAALLAFGPVAAGAATVSAAWSAKIGSAGVNGTATISAFTTGTGTMALKVARMKGSTSLPVVLHKGSCSSVGAVLLTLAPIRTTSSGAASRTSGLTAAQVTKITAAATAGKIAIRIGTGTARKCGLFAPLAIPPYVAASITVGRGPHGVAVSPSGAWVTNWLDNTLTRIDPTTAKVLQTLPLTLTGNAGPEAIAFGDGSLWVTTTEFDDSGNALAGSLVRVNPASGQQQATIPIGKGAFDVEVSPGAVWVPLINDNSVLRIDTATNAVAATIPVPGGPLGVAFGAGSLWVSSSDDGKVARIDPATNSIVTTIATQDSGGYVAFGGGAVWVTNAGHKDTPDGMLTRIDPATNGVTASVTVGSNPVELAYAGGSVWVGLFGTPTVVRVSATTSAVLNRVTVSHPVYSIAATEHAVWAVHNLESADPTALPPPGVVTRIAY